MHSSMHLWYEFLQIKDSLWPTSASESFKPGGPLPDQTMIQRFFSWLADCCTGEFAIYGHCPSEKTGQYQCKLEEHGYVRLTPSLRLQLLQQVPGRSPFLGYANLDQVGPS